MAVAPLTEVTPDILAMSWPNVDAMRMYFKRRKTTVAKLGLVASVAAGSGFIKVEPAGQAPAPAPAVESGGGDAAGDDPFEAWATEVDGLLQDANEEPERESVLAELWEAETVPADAVAEIIARRSDALERSVNAGEASCADCDASRPCWGSPDQCEVRLAPRVGDTAASVVQEPAGHPVEEALGALADVGAVVVADQDSDPIPHVTFPTGTLSPEQQAAVDPLLARSMAPADVPLPTSLAEQRRLDRQAASDVVAPAVAPTVSDPEPAAPALASEREFLATTLATLETLGMVPEEIVVEVARAVRQRIAELGPVARSRKRVRVDRLPQIIAALEREQGASGAHIQGLLGWDNPPGPWFFKEWARKADRLNDLTELPKVGGVRHWRLLVR